MNDLLKAALGDLPTSPDGPFVHTYTPTIPPSRTVYVLVQTDAAGDTTPIMVFADEADATEATEWFENVWVEEVPLFDGSRSVAVIVSHESAYNVGKYGHEGAADDCPHCGEMASACRVATGAAEASDYTITEGP